MKAIAHVVALFLMGGVWQGTPTGKPATPAVRQMEARKIIQNGDDKKLADWASFPLADLSILQRLRPVSRDRFGGRADLLGQKTGFFHVEQKGGRFWIVDPQGGLYLSDGINSVNVSSGSAVRGAFDRSFGSKGKWADQTASMLLDNGNNSVGAWSDAEAIRGSAPEHEHPLSYSVELHILGSYESARHRMSSDGHHAAYPKDALPLFDPEFAPFAQDLLRSIDGNRDDHNLLGYFSDNEIPLNTKNLDALLALPRNDAGYLAAAGWMSQQHASAPTDALRTQFLEFEANRYFQIVSTAIRRHDPNHMFLGCRFYARQLREPEMFRSAGRYADIISVNFYNRWTADAETTGMWVHESGRPFLISEFYTKAADAGMDNMAGAGWVVRTQDDRGLFYQNIVLSFLQSRGCVGWHWFKYQDDDPSLAHAGDSKIGSNKGIVNINYDPWRPLMSRMQAFNRVLYSLVDAIDAGQGPAPGSSSAAPGQDAHGVDPTP